MEERKKGAVKLKPKPLPKRKPLTKEELAARPAPKRARPLTKQQVNKRAAKKRKSRVSPERVAHLKKARAAKQKKHDDEKKILVSLKTFHIFGQERFGPGAVYVPQRLLLAVLEQDRRAMEAEQNLYTERSLIILSGHGAAAAFMVANPNFQEVWSGEHSPIFHQVSGKGMDIGQGPRF